MAEIQNLLKPYEVKLNGNMTRLVRDQEAKLNYLLTESRVEPETVCICAVGLFRQRPDENYLAILVPDKEDGEGWSMQFGLEGLLPWMSGVALGEEALHQMQHMNRSNGSFYKNHRWRPQTWIEDLPNEREHETYIQWVMRDLEAVVTPEDIPDDDAA